MSPRSYVFYLGLILACLFGIGSGIYIASHDPGLGPTHHLVRAWARIVGAPPLWRALGVDYPAVPPSPRDRATWAGLDAAKPNFPSRRTRDFAARLVDATGFEAIEPGREDGGGTVATGRSGRYLSGRLDEIFIRYRKPRATVRVLLATHDKPAENLLIVIPGSWGTSEHILGLRGADYHRKVGMHFFKRGMDVAAYDSAANGMIETWLNTLSKIEGGQVFGLWARGVCDLMDGPADKTIGRRGWRNRYRRVYLHGLSRGARTAEYISALCPGFALVFVEDNIHSDYQRYFWSRPDSTAHLKFGAWIDHLIPIIGQSSLVDFMSAARNPMVYTLSEEKFRSMHGFFGKGLRWREGVGESGRLRLVFKSGIGHKPEIELMENMMSGNWASITGVTFEPLKARTP